MAEIKTTALLGARQLILASIAFLLVMGMASAIDSEYTFKQNTQVDLKRPCISNGTWCSGSSVCNITITK